MSSRLTNDGSLDQKTLSGLRSVKADTVVVGSIDVETSIINNEQAINAINLDIDGLNTKTQNMSGITGSTSFTGNVSVSSGLYGSCYGPTGIFENAQLNSLCVGTGSTPVGYTLDVSPYGNLTTNFARFNNKIPASAFSNYTQPEGVSIFRLNNENYIRMVSGNTSINALEFNTNDIRDAGISSQHSTSASGRFMSFFVNGAKERVRIDYSGNVGIGTTTPAYKLDANGDINTNATYRINGASVLNGAGLTTGNVAFTGSLNGPIGVFSGVFSSAKSSIGDIFQVDPATGTIYGEGDLRTTGEIKTDTRFVGPTGAFVDLSATNSLVLGGVDIDNQLQKYVLDLHSKTQTLNSNYNSASFSGDLRLLTCGGPSLLAVDSVGTLTSNSALIASLMAVFLPSGVIVAYNSSTAPVGWALCDGSNGTPDLRGRFILGSGSGSGLTSRTLGATGGVESVVLSEDQMPSHTHTANTSGSHKHNFNVPRGDQSYTNGSGNTLWGNSWNWTRTEMTTNGDHTHTISSTGGDGSHENMPPFYVLTYIIKL